LISHRRPARTRAAPATSVWVRIQKRRVSTTRSVSIGTRSAAMKQGSTPIPPPAAITSR
jgi:hypothetical protein